MAFGALIACSSSSSDNKPTLKPPSNIDVASCASKGATLSACGDCCDAAGFAGATILSLEGEDKCVCGNAPGDPDAGAGVCTIDAAKADASACGSCCSTASYRGRSWTSDGSTSTCTCDGKFDKQVCAPESDANCHVCCLNAGYLSSQYSALDAAKCTCVAP